MIFFHFCINGSAPQEESNDTSVMNKIHGRTVTRSYPQDLTPLEALNALVKPIDKPLCILVCFHLPPHHSSFSVKKGKKIKTAYQSI